MHSLTPVKLEVGSSLVSEASLPCNLNVVYISCHNETAEILHLHEIIASVRESLCVTEEQRQKVSASFSSEGSSGSQPYPSQTPSSSSVPGVTTPQVAVYPGGGPPPMPYPTANQPLPLPVGYPSTKEDVNYLDEINK